MKAASARAPDKPLRIDKVENSLAIISRIKCCFNAMGGVRLDQCRPTDEESEIALRRLRSREEQSSTPISRSESWLNRQSPEGLLQFHFGNVDSAGATELVVTCSQVLNGHPVRLHNFKLPF